MTSDSGLPERGIAASSQEVFALIAILRGWMGTGPSELLREGDRKGDDLDAVLPLAIGTKTLGLLSGGFDRSGTAIPSRISDELAQRHQEILAINLRALTTIAKLAQAFADEGLPYVVIKGPLRAEQVYGSMDVRFGSDVDVYTDRDHYRAAAQVLEERLGYTCLVPKDDRWWHDYLGEAPFAATNPSAVLIDLHNQLQQPGGPYPSDLDSFVENAETRAIGRASARILSPENALMLTAISFGKAVRNAEPWIAYAHELSYALHQMPSSAEESLKDRARKIGIGRLFDEFLQASNALFADPIADDATEARKHLAMASCGLAPHGLLARSRASWRWTEGAGLARPARFSRAILREAKGRMAYRTSTRFD